MQAFKDADKYATKIRPGGYCFIDDVNWGELETNNLPKYIESLGFEYIHSVDACCYVYKKTTEIPVFELPSPPVGPSSCRAPSRNSPPDPPRTAMLVALVLFTDLHIRLNDGCVSEVVVNCPARLIICTRMNRPVSLSST